MSACVIVARFDSREGHAAEVEALLREFVEPSRGEAGCLFYDLHRDSKDPNGFVILDGWTDRHAFEAHAGSAHVARTLEKLEPLLAGPPALSELERVG